MSEMSRLEELLTRSGVLLAETSQVIHRTRADAAMHVPRQAYSLPAHHEVRDGGRLVESVPSRSVISGLGTLSEPRAQQDQAVMAQNSMLSAYHSFNRSAQNEVKSVDAPVVPSGSTLLQGCALHEVPASNDSTLKYHHNHNEPPPYIPYLDAKGLIQDQHFPTRTSGRDVASPEIYPCNSAPHPFSNQQFSEMDTLRAFPYLGNQHASNTQYAHSFARKPDAASYSLGITHTPFLVDRGSQYTAEDRYPQASQTEVTPTRAFGVQCETESSSIGIQVDDGLCSMWGIKQFASVASQTNYTGYMVFDEYGRNSHHEVPRYSLHEIQTFLDELVHAGCYPPWLQLHNALVERCTLLSTRIEKLMKWIGETVTPVIHVLIEHSKRLAGYSREHAALEHLSKLKTFPMDKNVSTTGKSARAPQHSMSVLEYRTEPIDEHGDCDSNESPTASETSGPEPSFFKSPEYWATVVRRERAKDCGKGKVSDKRPSSIKRSVPLSPQVEVNAEHRDHTGFITLPIDYHARRESTESLGQNPLDASRSVSFRSQQPSCSHRHGPASGDTLRHHSSNVRASTHRSGDRERLGRSPLILSTKPARHPKSDGPTRTINEIQHLLEWSESLLSSKE